MTEFNPTEIAIRAIRADAWDEGAVFMNERSWPRQRIFEANPYRAGRKALEAELNSARIVCECECHNG